MVSLRTAWLSVYNVLNAITDPESRTAKKWVYSAFPSDEAVQDSGYPILICWPPAFATPKLAFKTTHEKNFEFVIEVYTSDQHATQGKGAQQLSALTETVIEALWTAEATFIAAGLNEMTVSNPSSASVELMDGWKRHRQAFVVSFRGAG